MKRGRGRGFQRSHRVADLLQKTLAPMVMQEMNDARFRLLTITGVTMSSDLSYAKVYVSLMVDDPAEIQSMVKALNESAKSLRFELARAVELRIVPELKFVYDESIVHGFHMDSLIHEAMKKEEKK